MHVMSLRQRGQQHEAKATMKQLSSYLCTDHKCRTNATGASHPRRQPTGAATLEAQPQVKNNAWKYDTSAMCACVLIYVLGMTPSMVHIVRNHIIDLTG